ncbi:EthD family reductase [Cohnella sp. GCM10020058]|uniref:EthD family reductase n=1 Tax=Cohnella sp. GCM10020058 TaxID=3317330 RepID=UPI003631FD2D
MAKIVILFEEPVDREGFENHYENVHLPIARRLPDTVIKLGQVVAAPDVPAGYGTPYRMSEMSFESADAMRKALEGAEWAEVAKDAANLAHYLGKQPLVLLVE